MRRGALERIACAAWLALVALQPLWHGLLAPPARVPVAVAVLAATVPIALPLLALRRLHRALLLAAIVAMAYFCHGVMEAWAAPDVRALALVEAALALALALAVGTIGLHGRRAARRAAR